MKLYMAVTPDKYELPVFVEKDIIKLSRLTGQSANSIRSTICRNRKRKTKYRYNNRTKYRFYSVEVEEC